MIRKYCKNGQSKKNKGYSPKDFGAVGDGVIDDTVAIQKWAEHKEKRVLDQGIYLVSKPIVFTPGDEVIGEGGELLVADNFKGYSLLVCKATEDIQQRFTRLTIDMNKVDPFILSEKESDWVTVDTCFFKNTDKGFDIKQLQIEPPIEQML